jgi:hypothetical protein
MSDIDWSGCPIVQRNPKKLDGVPTVRDYRVLPIPSSKTTITTCPMMRLLTNIAC